MNKLTKHRNKQEHQDKNQELKAKEEWVDQRNKDVDECRERTTAGWF